MTIKTDSYVIGSNVDNTRNFLLDTDVAGSLRIRRKSDGSGGLLLSMDSNGKFSFPNGPAARTDVMSAIRLNTANGVGSTNTSVLRFTNQVLNTGSDITYADSATLGATFTINASGIYAISLTHAAVGAGDFSITRNSTALIGALPSTLAEVLAEATTAAANQRTNASIVFPLSTGDVIRAQTTSTPSSARQFFAISRVS